MIKGVNSLSFNNGGKIYVGAYTLTLPSASGTLARKQDIPSLPSFTYLPTDKIYLHNISAKLQVNTGDYNIFVYFSCYVFSNWSERVTNKDTLKTLLVQASNESHDSIPCNFQYRSPFGPAFMGFNCHANDSYLRFQGFQTGSLSASSTTIEIDFHSQYDWPSITWLEGYSYDHVISLGSY